MKTWPKTSVACASARHVRALLVGASLVAACAKAEPEQEAAPPPAPTSILSVTDAWARAADSGAMTAVYFTVQNSAAVSDTMSGVRSDAAEEVGLHMSMMQNGMMHMAPLRTLPVPAQDSVLFRPMGAHVMLTRLTRPLADGDTVTVTLEFVSGQSLEVRAGVRKP